MAKQKLTLIALVMSFFAPQIAAYFFYKAYQQGTVLVSYQSHGTLVPVGVSCPEELHHDRYWTLVALQPQICDERCSLWLNELPKFPSVLSKYDLDVRAVSLNDRYDTSQLQAVLDWNWNQDGGVLFVDPKGYVALAYPYQSNVKKAFLDIKKLLAATH